MDVTFSARLRAHRERQQISLAAISATTKIKPSLLDELERGNVSHWPEGIFRRAYLRSYATAIGLDPEATLREFRQLYPDPAEIAERERELATPPPSGVRGLVSVLASRASTGRRPTPSTTAERVPDRPESVGPAL